MLERNGAGECVFFERGSRLCIVHRDLGEPVLPATCRHFPRLALRDGRGTFITLSHFCPTAASLLFRDDVPLQIVSEPVSFPDADYEGMVVTADDVPPLLQPKMLMDLDGYGAWERHMVARCAATGFGPESVLATLAKDVRLLRRWKPNGDTLSQSIATLPSDGADAAPPLTLDWSLQLHDQVMAAIPDDLKPASDTEGLESAFHGHVQPTWKAMSAPIKRYLAAKAFASWTAYQGRGIATIVRGLEAALALVRVEAARQCRDAGRALDVELLREAFRRADFALNHLAIGEDLARAWSLAEQDH